MGELTPWLGWLTGFKIFPRKFRWCLLKLGTLWWAAVGSINYDPFEMACSTLRSREKRKISKISNKRNTVGYFFKSVYLWWYFVILALQGEYLSDHVIFLVLLCGMLYAFYSKIGQSLAGLVGKILSDFLTAITIFQTDFHIENYHSFAVWCFSIDWFPCGTMRLTAVKFD